MNGIGQLALSASDGRIGYKHVATTVSRHFEYLKQMVISSMNFLFSSHSYNSHNFLSVNLVKVSNSIDIIILCST